MFIFFCINFSSMLHNFTLQIGFFSCFKKKTLIFWKKKILNLIVFIELNFWKYVYRKSNFSISVIKICIEHKSKPFEKKNLGIWEHWPGGRKIRLESDCLPRLVQPLSGSRCRGGGGGTECSRSVAGSYGQGQGHWWRAAWWFSERSTGQKQI